MSPTLGGALIDASELSRFSDDRECVIVDCRFNLLRPEAGHEAYLAGHVPGARYAHLDNDLARNPTANEGRHPLPDPEAFADRLGHWGISAQSFVVAYDDRSGAIAARLWWMLRWLGHERTAVLDGGLSAWVSAGFPVTAALPKISACTYEIRSVHDDWVVTTAELLDKIGAGPVSLLDARSEPRFQGLEEPIDPVAGHVPGAVSYPFDRNIDEVGKLRPLDDIRANFDALAARGSLDSPIVMCGSGVTACHLLLALEQAGIAGSRLYAGSWSEWIRDAERPVATGP